jgi:ATP-dependent Clp protease, protease subunit
MEEMVVANSGGTISSGDAKTNRWFILNTDVSPNSVETLIKEIHEINRYDEEQEKKVVGYKRKPIEIVVNTYGGSVYDGYALVSEILMSKTPVHTILQGKAMSMGFIIFLAGHKRIMTQFATLMYHEISTFEWNDITAIKRSVEEAERLQRLYDDYVLKRTNLLQEKLDDVKEKRMNWFIGADEAKKLGITDEVISFF